ncbi:Cationic amino acid transporter 7, chloroplastic [Datura stramonium]|uniref:Cationic amino acid transporter 7, chloroplastic n=1 Tax=Datura stramonium TaxID=4076 RepID=A0ABS8UJT6_DATST|nr:Cationic amino acid transporter 7, chloroplastic [Datura stramonium]
MAPLSLNQIPTSEHFSIHLTGWLAGPVPSRLLSVSRVRARSGGDMKRSPVVRPCRIWCQRDSFGAGVFVTSGRASRMCAGPAVVLSYAIAGLCALLSAFCYTEFAVDMPVAGGAFSYIRITFGPFSYPNLLN